jgi:VanZ family protein
VTTPSDANETEASPSRLSGFLRNVVPALLWTLALFFGGGGPPPPEGPGELIGIPSDKALHAVAFLVLAVRTARAVRFELPARARGSRVGIAVAISVAVGVLLEVYQLALPDRSAEVADAVADAIGAVLGGVVLLVLRRG